MTDIYLSVIVLNVLQSGTVLKFIAKAKQRKKMMAANYIAHVEFAKNKKSSKVKHNSPEFNKCVASFACHEKCGEL